MKIIGETEKNILIAVKKVDAKNQEIHLVNPLGLQFGRTTELLLKRPAAIRIQHASLQHLTSPNAGKYQSLLALVYEDQSNDTSYFKATLFLIEHLVQTFDDSPNQERCASIIILEEIPLVKAQTKKLQVHILPSNPTKIDPTIPLSGLNTPCVPTPAGGTKELIILRNRVIALSLEECITIYEIETTLSSEAGAKIEIISSDFISKSFWWSQWVTEENFLAFAHFRKPQHSSIEDESSPIQRSKPILSVFQFHANLPRETVLNFPLDDDVVSGHCENSRKPILAPHPNVFYKGRSPVDNFRILAHSSGHVSIFQVSCPLMDTGKNASSTIVFKLSALHHNKTLRITLDVEVEKLIVDVCLFQNGQFVAVMGYPFFLHLLDVGVGHEPSHHLLLDWSSLPMSSSVTNVTRIFTDVAAKYLPNRFSNTLTLVTEDLSKTELEINSGLLIPLLLNRKPDMNFSLAVIHYLILHLYDVNAAKKIIYEMGRSPSNPYLTEIFQEFVISTSFLMTKKQLMPNMNIFLNFLPYTSLRINNLTSAAQEKNVSSIETAQNSAAVLSMLLSPRQRILPHTMTDIWTQLWELSGILSKSTRFCHRSVAQKLLLSLQCYQPEALSRATTPMSPSSPMVCKSLGDIAALFGRRSSDLQLPFVEHESCTANKQEYVYSVNLRELSTHLLKERRDWPLHGQTVSGKYMNSLVESGRLLCHLLCLCLHLQPHKNKSRGFQLIDSLDWEVSLKLFMLLEHFSIALGTLACPLPQGFTPFFAFLGYRVLKYDQFLWHVRSGTFDLQIDLAKTIMEDLSDAEEGNVSKKLHLISLLPKARGSRVLNGWYHQAALCLRARQHSSDLLSGVTSVSRKSTFASQSQRMKLKGTGNKDSSMSPLDTFFHLLTAKANVVDIDLGLLTEATMLSMQLKD